MSDDRGDEQPEPLEIDVRSPGERWLAGGRDGIARMRDLADASHLDLAALAWIVLLLVMTGARIYGVLWNADVGGFQGGSDWWTKILLLSNSASALLFACPVAIALAVGCPSAISRLALRLTVIAGAWIAVAGILGIAVAFHNTDRFSPGASVGVKAPQGIADACFGALGLVIALVAWRFALPDGGRSEPPGTGIEVPVVDLS